MGNPIGANDNSTQRHTTDTRAFWPLRQVNASGENLETRVNSARETSLGGAPSRQERPEEYAPRDFGDVAQRLF